MPTAGSSNPLAAPNARPRTTASYGEIAQIPVKHTGLERPARRVRAMHQHVAVPGGGLCLCHRADDPVGHVRHQRIVRDRGIGWPVTGHEDRYTVMITAIVIDLFTVRRPANTAPVVSYSSINRRAGPSSWADCPSEPDPNHSCSRSKPSPPGFPGSSLGPAMCPSSDIDV
jgi:hypothetical protein